MSVLVANATIDVRLVSGGVDSHGWAMTETSTDGGTLIGSIQEGAASGNPEEPQPSGDWGVAAPDVRRRATAYLPQSVPAGCILEATGVRWRVKACWLVDDPFDVPEDVSVWVADLVEDDPLAAEQEPLDGS